MESVLLLSAAASAAADNTVTVRRYRDGLRLSDREVSLRVSGPTSGTVAAAAVVTVDGGRGSGRPEATRSNPPNKYGRKLHHFQTDTYAFELQRLDSIPQISCTS